MHLGLRNIVNYLKPFFSSNLIAMFKIRHVRWHAVSGQLIKGRSLWTLKSVFALVKLNVPHLLPCD